MGMRLILLCCLLASLSVIGSAKITHRKVERTGRKFIQVEVPFGFSNNGRVELELTRFRVETMNNAALPSEGLNLGFYLTKHPNLEVFEYEILNNQGELREDEKTKVIVESDEEGMKKLIHKETDRLKVKKNVTDPGLYVLFFANHAPLDIFPEVSFHIRVAMYNQYTSSSGSLHRDYLSVGEQELPLLYLIMFLVFCSLAVLWVSVCVKERANVHSIHHLMFVLIVLRAFTLFTQTGMYHYDQISGNPDGWNIAYYVFTFIRGVMFFVVIVLIGTGWSYLRPFIGEKEKKILVVVVPLQIFANIAIIVLEETSPVRATWFTWQDIFHLVDIICCCAILFPIVWSIKHLREGAETDGKAAANIEKLTLFRQFYIMVVVYIYFTRIIVYILGNLLPYDMKWMSQLAFQLATLIFFVMTGVKFAPHKENRYLKLENDTV